MEGRRINRKENIAVEIHLQRLLVNPFNGRAIDRLEFTLLPVHVVADPGAQARTNGGRAKHLIQLTITDKQTGPRADRRANHGALLGLAVGVIGRNARAAQHHRQRGNQQEVPGKTPTGQP
ncbi:MAG: hypothetical protein AAGH19_06400 [Pseudomonadota bacterium]